MEKKIKELEKQLSKKDLTLKKVKERNSTLTKEVLTRERYTKALIGQYERVVREYRKNFDLLIKNWWKIVAVLIIQKYNKLRRR